MREEAVVLSSPVLGSSNEKISLQDPQISSRSNQWSDYKEPDMAFEDTEASMQRVAELVLQALVNRKTEDTSEVIFNITWQFQRCIRDELNGDLDLEAVSVVTGNAAHAWATSCGEYLEHTWPEDNFGQKSLLDIEILLGRDFTTEGRSDLVTNS
jgi:hypothetical protein